MREKYYRLVYNLVYTYIIIELFIVERNTPTATRTAKTSCSVDVKNKESMLLKKKQLSTGFVFNNYSPQAR